MSSRESGLAPSFADADGLRIRIHHLGGSGPPLVCVHATGFHGRVWEPFIPPLREHFSIVALDQRGHGESDKPESGYEWHGFGRDVLAVVDQLELERPAAIGHSAGAAALIFAETSRPGTFSRLVLMDPVTPQPDVAQLMGEERNFMSEQARRRRAIWDSRDEMIERLKTGTPLSDWHEEFIRAYVTYGTKERDDGTVELACPPEIEAQVYMMGGRHDGWDRMADLTCPVLLLTGQTSPMWDAERTELAASRLKNGRAQTILGGHFFPMENPEETTEAVKAFLLEGT